MRRDVRYRGFPFRTGGLSTAIEICAGTGDCSPLTNSDEADFFVSFLGESTYARGLAVAHIQAIDDRYTLNGRYRRAFMINPGYDWTPTQTGGTAIFSVSQKLFMFALITLDENVASASGNAAPDEKFIRRRMLLSSVDDGLKAGAGSPSGLGSANLEFETSPKQMLVSAYDVADWRVATFAVTMQLTEAEACMTENQLIGTVRKNLEDAVMDHATKIQTVQILKATVEKNGVQCRRRSLRGLQSFSAATVTTELAVVFEKGTGDAAIDLKALMARDDITSFESLDVSTRVGTSPTTPPKADYNEDSKSSTNVGLIAGVAGGAGALVVLLVGGFLFMKSRSETAQPVTAVQTINVEDLKSQLAGEV
jgi:metal-sulfur cluster biosynthetic enzyme